MHPAQPDRTFRLNSDCIEFFLQKSHMRNFIFTLTRDSLVSVKIPLKGKQHRNVDFITYMYLPYYLISTLF